ncbi:MAG: putative quinol monooxygenase [Pseudomonadota bacterium]
MQIERRTMLGGAIAAVGAAGAAQAQENPAMYGLIGKMTARPGQRDALITILLEGVSGMPGCLSYIVAQDPRDADAIWVTEVWDTAASHRASLSLPSVQAAIAKGRPLIAGMEAGTQTVVMGGHGLVKS